MATRAAPPSPIRSRVNMFGAAPDSSGRGRDRLEGSRLQHAAHRPDRRGVCRELSRVGGYVGPVTQRSVPVDAYIIGAGPGGLATAAALEARGLHGVVLERSNGVGTSWRAHYDRLHLHTPRELSGLPGLPIPKEMGRWVSRDDVVRYLELYAAHHRPRRAPRHRGAPRRPVRGRRLVDPHARGRDDAHGARTPSSRPGFNHTPREPDVPGLQGYSG